MQAPDLISLVVGTDNHRYDVSQISSYDERRLRLLLFISSRR